MEEGFEVIVSVTGEIESSEVAIAEATRYLTYGDHSDTFGEGEVFDVNVYDGPDGGWNDDEELDWGIGLHFTAPVASDDELEAFMNQLTILYRVESVERLPITLA